MCAWQLDMLLFLRRYLQHGWFQSSDKKAGHHYKEMPQESSQVSLDLQLSVEESQLFGEQQAAPRHNMWKHFYKSLQWCDKLQGQREELDLTPLYKRCPDAQETCRNIVSFLVLTAVIRFVLFLPFKY